MRWRSAGWSGRDRRQLRRLLNITEVIQLDRRVEDCAPPLHRDHLLSGTHRPEVRDCLKFQSDRFRYLRHLSENAHQLAVVVAKILLESLNGENYPVGIPFFIESVCRGWHSNDGFLRERYHRLGEAAGLRAHNESVPLHFLICMVVCPIY